MHNVLGGGGGGGDAYRKQGLLRIDADDEFM